MNRDSSAAVDGHTDDDFLLEVLFYHKLDWIRRMLKTRGLRQSGTAEMLRDRIVDYLDRGKLATSDLIELLDEVEGWGDQHVYLYSVSKTLIDDFSDEKAFRVRLKENGVSRLFNKRHPLVLPTTATLSEIEWSTNRVRFVWIEKREYRDRIEDEDREEGSIEFDAYKVQRSRGIVSFSCDLVAGTAELMIQRLPSGNNYTAEKLRFEALMGSFMDVSALSLKPVAPAIKKIDSIKEIRKRSCEWATIAGDRVKYTSSSRKADAYKNPAIRKSRKELGNVAGRLGNYYWPIQGREIHVTLYAKDQRIGIFGECTQAEVTDVLSEVRGYC